jgi:DNA-binding MarR family transcriptional regulator
MNNKSISQIGYSILRISTMLESIKKELRYFGTDQMLYGAEISMLRSIKENEGISVTDLAEKLGVTKGAVSQILKKLQRKGMVLKCIDSTNQSRLNLSLTEKGRGVYVNHAQRHKELDDAINAILRGANSKDIEFLKHFLTEAENRINDYKAKQKSAEKSSEELREEGN